MLIPLVHPGKQIDYAWNIANALLTVDAVVMWSVWGLPGGEWWARVEPVSTPHPRPAARLPSPEPTSPLREAGRAERVTTPFYRRGN